uniref:DYW domain-containing protein n=1 Tax=Ananas comosus var. bracteatus TaxID=296719 RepID=A0A6V7PJ14_ANACO|nr:unnamed protein product [Ananas comosus var. bracteatus]
MADRERSVERRLALASCRLPPPERGYSAAPPPRSPPPPPPPPLHARLLLRPLRPPDLVHARLLFSHLPRPNAFAYNAMIRAHSRAQSPRESVLLYKSMVSNGAPLIANNFTFTFLVNACAKLPSPDVGFGVHCHVVKCGFHSDTYVMNSLMHLYSSFGDMPCARKVFDACSQRDAVSFNTMMDGYAKAGEAVNGLSVFKQMLDSDSKPDSSTFASVLSLCSELGDARTGKMVHLLAYKTIGSDKFSNYIVTALVDMYSRCGMMRLANQAFRMMGDSADVKAWSSLVSGYARCGDIGTARKLFSEMPQKDLIAWTALISGCARSGKYREALEIFMEMEKEGLRPDEVTMVTVLSACAQLGALDLGKKLHGYVEDDGLLNRNPRIITAIVDIYAKCGCIQEALDIFYKVDYRLKTVELFNAIISGLAQHGLGEKAIAVFGEMESLGFVPDEITFVGVLCACSHSGLVSEGTKLFDSMVKYGLKPQIEHYGCMVDLFGQVGLLNEARSFIEKMPIKANSVIWSALLRSCRIHRNAEIGELAKEQLLQLNRNYKERDFLLSDLFSDVKRRDYAQKLRDIINYRHNGRRTGYSYVEWDGTVHQFSANMNSHPQAKEISIMLEEISRRLSFTGYDTVTEQILYNVGKDKKGSLVPYHSEKVALAFGLINLGAEEPVKIVTNLRMCSDCHSSFKLLSKIFNREITVRDGIRFHEIKHGLCSCEDNWLKRRDKRREKVPVEAFADVKLCLNRFVELVKIILEKSYYLMPQTQL